MMLEARATPVTTSTAMVTTSMVAELELVVREVAAATAPPTTQIQAMDTAAAPPAPMAPPAMVPAPVAQVDARGAGAVTQRVPRTALSL